MSKIEEGKHDVNDLMYDVIDNPNNNHKLIMAVSGIIHSCVKG